jgi:hypothetical protein
MIPATKNGSIAQSVGKSSREAKFHSHVETDKSIFFSELSVAGIKENNQDYRFSPLNPRFQHRSDPHPLLFLTVQRQGMCSFFVLLERPKSRR